MRLGNRLWAHPRGLIPLNLSQKTKKHDLRTCERVSSRGEQGKNKTTRTRTRLHTPWVCVHVPSYPQGSVHVQETTLSVEMHPPLYHSVWMDNLYNTLLQRSSMFPGPFWANHTRSAPRDIFIFRIFVFSHLGSDVNLRHPGVFVFRPDLGYFVTALHQRRWFITVSFIILLY